MLIDDVTTRVAAGDGGKGAVAFNKNMMSLGPTGAAGGHGGNVIAVGVSDMSALNQFRFKKEFVAERWPRGPQPIPRRARRRGPHSETSR